MTRARLRVAQRILGTIGILIALSAVATIFLPFRILDIQCGPAVTGSKVEIGGPRGSLVQDHEGPVCHNKGSSRLITAGVVFVLAAGLGYGGWFLPLEPSWYRAEEDDDGQSHFDRAGPAPPVPPKTGPSRAGPATPAPVGPVQTKPRVLLGDHVREQRAAGGDDGGDDGGVEPSPPERSPVPARGRSGAWSGSGPAAGHRPTRPPGRPPGTPARAPARSVAPPTRPARRPARPPAPATGAPGNPPDRPARPGRSPAPPREGPGRPSTGRPPVKSPSAKSPSRPP